MNKIKRYLSALTEGRNSFVFGAVLIFTAIFLPVTVTEAATSDVAYARSLINSNRYLYGEKYAPAQKLSSGEIDLSTGEVSINEVDLSLPGKGGLDLNIHRTYSSQEAKELIRFKESEYSKFDVYKAKAYVYTVIDGSNQKVNISFPMEEEMVDTIRTEPDRIASNWNTDTEGTTYKEYSKVAVSDGKRLLIRDKTREAKDIMGWTYYGINGVSKDEGNIYVPTGNNEWKIARPYVSCSVFIQENTRKVFYMKFGNEKGEVYDMRFYILGTYEDEIWYPENFVKFYGKDYSAELTLDEENLNYILTLTDKEGRKYRFDLGNLKTTVPFGLVATSISDRFGNEIRYNGTEIIDTYGRKLRVSGNGIEIYNGNSYKYIVKYDVEKIIDEDRDPYDKLTIFTKYQLTVSRNTSPLDSATDVFEDTKYITQAKETVCSLNNYEHIPVYLLKEVIYPEGMKVVYTYETEGTEEKIPAGYSSGEIPNYFVSRVLSKAEYAQNGDEYEQKINRVFNYDLRNSLIEKVYTTKTETTERIWIGNTEYKTITSGQDAFGRTLTKKEVGTGNTLIEEYYYKYASVEELRYVDLEDYSLYRQVPVSIVSTRLNDKVVSAIYSEYTANKKPTVQQQGLQKTTYVYDDTYQFVTESTQTIDFDRKLKTVGTKTEDGKNIAKKEVFEIVGDVETLQGVTEYTYNADGTVSSETVKLNSNGDTVRTTYAYDYSLFENTQNGKHSVTATVATTDAAGNTRSESTTVEYDLLGNVIKETDAGGNSTEYKYDLMRRVTEEIYADGTNRSIVYDTVGRTVTITEPNGKKIAYEYDPRGNHIKTYLPDENNATLISNSYDNLDRKIQTTVYNDQTASISETYEYDTLDRITKQTIGDECIQYQIDKSAECFYLGDYGYHTVNLEKKYAAALIMVRSIHSINSSRVPYVNVVVDGEKLYDLWAYFDSVRYQTIDLRGKDSLLLEMNMKGQISVFLVKEGESGAGTLGANTVVTATTTGDQSFTPAKTKGTYDSMGKVISEEKRDNTTDAVLTRDEYSYDFLGNVKEYRDSKVTLDGVGAFTTQTEYNWQGLPTTETNAVGDSKIYTYDLLGRLVEAQDETGAKTTFVYDQLGREIVAETEITDTETARTEKYYDLSGNVIRERIKNNKTGETATYSEVCYEYDSIHRPTAIKTNDGTRDIYTQYAYDSMGNVTKVVTGQTQKVDLNGEIPQIANITQYEYDRFGNVTKTTDANGLFETAEYNYIGLPISTTDKKGVTTTYTYNSYGSPLTIATQGMDTITYTYNVNNMPTSVTQGTNTIIYEYDALGRLTKETENGIVKTYSMDKVGNRTSSNVGGVETAYTYDALNRLTGVTFEGGSAGYTYDKASRLTGETKGGIETSYTYNKAGWLTNKTNTKDGQETTYALTYSNDGNIVSRTENGKTTNYTYDNLGQLIAEDDTLYEYDTRGNRIKKTSNGVITDYRYDRTNKLMTENVGNIWTAYAYDENGNNTLRETYEQIIVGGETLQNELEYLILGYDPLNRLTKAQKDDMTAEYTYGIDNMRLTKTVNGETQKFIWDGANIVGITDAEDTITNRYYRGIGLIASKENDVLSYYQTNDHGDVSAWGDISYSYDAFGNQENQSNDENPFRYTGEYQDSESGLIYLRARMYDPSTGRFINEDPIRDGLNWYVYCGGNPVMFVDPWGLVPTPGEAAAMAEHIYKDIPLSDNSSEMAKAANRAARTVSGWRLIDVYSKGSFKMGVYIRDGEDWENPTEYCLVNRGTTDAEGSGFDWDDNLLQPIGASGDMSLSLKTAKWFSNAHADKEITFVGHSKGGGEAMANAVATNRNVITFNPAKANLNAYNLSKEKKAYSATMTHYVVEGEILNWLFKNASIGTTVKLPTQAPIQGSIDEKIEKRVENHHLVNVKSALIEKGIK